MSEKDSDKLFSVYNTSHTISDCKTSKEHHCQSQDIKNAEQIVSQYHNAVVEIAAEFILLGASGADVTTSNDVALQPLAPNGRVDVILRGNGFFIKKHYIVAPAQLLLLPPSLTAVTRRYPFVNNAVFDGRMHNSMTRASRILVTVHNVNNNKHSFVYEAQLVGVDGAGDIAVLCINSNKEWNSCNNCNPRIEKCHPYFKFGRSTQTMIGEKVYIISSKSVCSIVEGLLSDNSDIDSSGWILAETIAVTTSNTFSSKAPGAPIVDCRGCVIGMQTTSKTCEIVRGPSECFMRHVVKTMVRGSSCDDYNVQLQVICDPIGNYYRYRKAYLGIAYEVMTGADYDITTNYDSVITNGAPRVRLDSNGNFLTSPSCKEIIGIKVLGVAGLNPNNSNNVSNGAYYVPGNSEDIALIAPLLDNLPVSPLIEKIQPGDIITHINSIPVGNLYRQSAPSLITWHHIYNDQLTVWYRRGGNYSGGDTNDFEGNYDNLYSHTFCASDYPLGLDYPWYTVDIFPLLSTMPYPGFIFNNQLQNPQLPQLTTSYSHFHPSI